MVATLPPAPGRRRGRGEQVDATLTEDQQLLADSVARIAEDLAPASVAALDTDDDGAGWQVLVDTGLLTLRARSAEGTRASGVEAAIVAEAFGRKLSRVPFVGALLATELLIAAGAEEELTAVASGARRVCIALDPDLARVAGTARALAWDGGGASHAATVARDERGWVVATRPVAGRRVESIDPTRTVVERRAARSAAALGQLDDAAMARWTAFALTVLCADMVGLMQGALDLAVAHASQRVQFGRRIGSFQAIQHLCAEQHVSIEAARSATYHAAWAVDGLDAEDARDAASAAKVYVSAEAVTVTESAIQVLGGIGHTWESLAHLHLRRSLMDRATLGDDTTHLSAIADALSCS